MEVSRFINEQPVGAVPPMKIANEGVLKIMREVRLMAAQAEPGPQNGRREQETSSNSG